MALGPSDSLQRRASSYPPAGTTMDFGRHVARQFVPELLVLGRIWQRLPLTADRIEAGEPNPITRGRVGQRGDEAVDRQVVAIQTHGPEHSKGWPYPSPMAVRAHLDSGVALARLNQQSVWEP